MIETDQSFNVLENPTLRHFVKLARPEYKMPRRKWASAQAREKWGARKLGIKETLGKMPGKLSFSFDIWLSTNDVPFIALVAHGVDSQWRPRRYLLCLQRFPGAHGGARLAATLMAQIESYDVQNRIMAFTGDNASNNVVAMEVVGEMLSPDHAQPDEMPELEPLEQFTEPTNYFRCGAHVTNLAGSQFFDCFLKRSKRVREDGLEEETEIQALSSDAPLERALRKVRLLATRLHKSSMRSEHLAQCQQFCGLSQRKIPTYCRTRWNTAYDQMAVALGMRDAIDMFMRNDSDYRSLRITAVEWEQLAWLVEQLRPFKEVTVMLESHWTTISMFIPMMNRLMDGLEDESEGAGRAYILRRTACRLAKEKLAKYYSATVVNHWYTTAISEFSDRAVFPTRY